MTQEGLDKLFKINNAGTKRMLDAWVKPKDDKLAVEETEILEMPAVPESTDSEIWESFRNKLLETNAGTNPSPLGSTRYGLMRIRWTSPVPLLDKCRRILQS